jgi:UPF0755 protein
LKNILYFALLFIAGLMAGVVLFIYAKVDNYQTSTLSLPTPFIVEIERGDTVNALARRLEAMGVVDNELWVRLLARLGVISPHIKVGEYRIEQPMTLPDLFSLFSAGKVIAHQITFPEGWTLKKILEELQLHEKLRRTLVDPKEDDILRLLEINGSSAEGWIFPDTYHYVKGDSDVELLRRAHRSMQAVLSDAWEKRSVADLSPAIKTSYDALILASLIERETSVGSERAIISSVFHNRLSRGMKLQTDPTVIYALGDAYDGNIRRSDLRLDSPYNTYLYRGLPPTPIAMPGRDSIYAGLQPLKTSYLFFVAKGDGYHEFSETLEQHNAAVKKYQIIRRAKAYKSTPGK